MITSSPAVKHQHPDTPTSATDVSSQTAIYIPPETTNWTISEMQAPSGYQAAPRTCPRQCISQCVSMCFSAETTPASHGQSHGQHMVRQYGALPKRCCHCDHAVRCLPTLQHCDTVSDAGASSPKLLHRPATSIKASHLIATSCLFRSRIIPS